MTWGKKNKGQGVCGRLREGRGICQMGAGTSGGVFTKTSRTLQNYAITRRRLHGERGDAECAPMSEWQLIPESRTAMGLSCPVTMPC